MIKRLVIAIFGFLLVVAALGAFKWMQIQKMMGMQHTMPPSAVTTIEAKSEVWAPSLEAIATLAPVEGAMVATDADGVVSRIAVDNGAEVEAGQLLIELDTTVEAAQLAAAEARLKIADLNRNRADELLAKSTISQAELDQADAQLNQAKADVEALKALLGKKQVRAPFAGRVGIRQVNVGQFVARGAPLVPLQKLDSIYVNFTIPQREMPSLRDEQTLEIAVDAYPGRSFEGRIVAINPQVDSVSRNVYVQGLIKNTDEALRPGMFAKVKVILPESDPMVIVPATAVAYASYGNSVFVIEQIKGEDGQEYLGARQQFVKLGPTRGDRIAITEGLKPGEVVATAGVFKLRNGAHVLVNNEKLPSNSATPEPTNS